MIFFSLFFLLVEIPVFSEMVAYDYPKHSKEDAGAKLILMPGTMPKNWNLRVSGWTLGGKKQQPTLKSVEQTAQKGCGTSTFAGFQGSGRQSHNWSDLVQGCSCFEQMGTLDDLSRSLLTSFFMTLWFYSSILPKYTLNVLSVYLQLTRHNYMLYSPLPLLSIRYVNLEMDLERRKRRTEEESLSRRQQWFFQGLRCWHINAEKTWAGNLNKL